jgi:dTDP-4-dehydrorhamnose reductase
LIQPTTSDKINWVAKRPKNASLNVTKAQRSLKKKPLSIRDAIRILREELKN